MEDYSFPYKCVFKSWPNGLKLRLALYVCGHIGAMEEVVNTTLQYHYLYLNGEYMHTVEEMERSYLEMDLKSNIHSSFTSVLFSTNY